MTFTELEYVLMLAVAVLLWRVSSMQRRIDQLILASDTYARFLINIGEGKGIVAKNENGNWAYKEKTK
jgi:hypothetical protein